MSDRIIKKAIFFLLTGMVFSTLLSGCQPLADPDLSSYDGSEGDRLVGYYIIKDADYDYEQIHSAADSRGRIYADFDADSDFLVSSFPFSGYANYMEITYEPSEYGGSYPVSSLNISEGITSDKYAVHFYGSGVIATREALTCPGQDSTRFNRIQSGITNTMSYCLELNGTMTVVASDFWGPTDEKYLNLARIYREPDGDYYMICGSFYGVDDSSSLSLYDSWTPSNYNEELTSTFSFTIEESDKPVETAILQYDADHQLVSSDTYTPGSIPETLQPETETAYLIIECSYTAEDGTISVKRSMLEAKNEKTDYEDSDDYDSDAYNVFSDTYENSEGIIVSREVKVLWN